MGSKSSRQCSMDIGMLFNVFFFTLKEVLCDSIPNPQVEQIHHVKESDPVAVSKYYETYFHDMFAMPSSRWSGAIAISRPESRDPLTIGQLFMFRGNLWLCLPTLEHIFKKEPCVWPSKCLNITWNHSWKFRFFSVHFLFTNFPGSFKVSGNWTIPLVCSCRERVFWSFTTTSVSNKQQVPGGLDIGFISWTTLKESA